MTNIVYEKDGFTLEQKFRGRAFKAYIYFDDVSNKTGYYKNINYLSLLFAVMFLAIVLVSVFYRKKTDWITIFYGSMILFFVYDFFSTVQNYQTLTLKKSNPIYFKQNEYHLIEEIITKRNEYFYNTYFKNIKSYDAEARIGTVNWLYNEKAVSKEEAAGVADVAYDEENQIFILKKIRPVEEEKRMSD